MEHLEEVEINCNGLYLRISPTTRTLIYKCKNLHLRLARTYNHIGFLRRCRRNDIVPSGLRPTIPDLPKKRTLQHRFGRTLVNEQLKVLYKKKKADIMEERKCRDELSRTLDQRSWSIVWIWILVCEEEVFRNIREKQMKKFDRLQQEKQMNVEKEQEKGRDVHHRIINLSSRVLTVAEQNLLAKGLNFVPMCNRKVSSDVVADVEKTAKRLGDKGQVLVHVTKTYMNGGITHDFKDNLTVDEREALRGLSKDETIVITNADKGKAVVVLDKGDYNNKILQVLNSKDYTKLQWDPTLNNEKTLKKKLVLLKDGGFLEDKCVTDILHTNSKIPSVYGCPKIHKEGVPMRLIVSTLGTQLSALAKFLTPIINHLAYPENHISLKNSQEFVKLIHEHNPSRPFLMLSFDVVNLFGSVPKSDCLGIVRTLLEEDLSLHLRTNLPVSTILELITVCLDNTYFKFNDDFYEQKNGLAMGSPLSPALASIYMNNFENKMKGFPLYTFVDFLRRYVDDYFAMWGGDESNLEEFQEQINTIDSNIRLTKEVEKDGILPYLDVQVQKTNTGIRTYMYEKPIASGIILNYNSSHPKHVKENIVSNMVEKVRQCSDGVTQDFEKLSRNLKSNGYPKHVIDKAIKQSGKTSGNNKKDQKGPGVVVPFNGSKAHMFKRKAKDIGVRTFFKRNKNIGEIINKTGRTKGNRDTNVVYKIPCECGKFYIGETYRELNIRINEHKGKVKNEDTCNGLARHVKETKHKILFDKYEILDKEENENKRKIKEAYWIKKLKPALNLNNGVIISDLW